MSLHERILGAWRLLDYAEVPEDGGVVVHPLGADAGGMILYTHDGFMAAQLMRTARPTFVSGDWFRGTDSEVRAAGDFIAYAAPFAVDEGAGLVRHGPVAISYFPNWLTQMQVRVAECQADRLQLSTAQPYLSGGQIVRGRLLWERASTPD